MSTSTRTRWLQKDAARRLTQAGLRGAGTLKAVGRALPVPRQEGTVGSYVTRTDCPQLFPLVEMLAGVREWDAELIATGLGILAGLNRSEETRGRALAEACLAAVDYREIVTADRRTLEERARYLLSARHTWNAEEGQAVEASAPDAPERLEREGWGQIELATVLRVLEEAHGVRVTDLARAHRRRA